MIKTSITHKLRGKQPTTCSKEDLQLTAKKLYGINPADEHPFNIALFDAYMYRLEEIIYGKTKRNIFYIYVDWVHKELTVNFDNKELTQKTYTW